MMLHPFQYDIINKVINGNDIQIIQAGRGVGKSVFASYINGVMQDPNYEIVVDEGRVSGARYYTAQPTSGFDWSSMTEWMVETFGPTAHDGVWTPGMRWYANNAKFWFRNEADLVLFLLKWQK